MTWLPVPLETSRLVLRVGMIGDEEGVAALFVDPEVRRYLGGALSAEQATARARLAGAGATERFWGHFVVVDRAARAVIGMVSFDDQRGRWQLSYEFHPGWWGKGLAREATQGALEWFWRERPELSEVIAVTQVANTKSCRLLERLGFQAVREFVEFDALQREYVLNRQVWVTELKGGYVTRPLRVGSTVRRQLGSQPRPEFVRELLTFFESSAWLAAPRFLGIDEEGREMLSYIDGQAAWGPVQPDGVWSDDSLVAVAQLVREFHDLTAGTTLAAGEEVVCHNDLSPRNTIYRDAGKGFRPVAFVDWDLAAPGVRIHDVALICWQFVSLGPERDHDVEIAARQVRILVDGYGWEDRSKVIETALWWQDRCWRGINEKAAAGDPSVARLVEVEASRHVREAYDWLSRNRGSFEKALR